MTDQVRTHYFGDNCPGGHLVDELKGQIEELVKSAQRNREKACEYERRADARFATLRELEYNQHLARAEKGNLASKVIINNPKELELVTDIRASNDTIWKAHVANHKFYQRKANMDNEMARTLQGELERHNETS